MTFHLDSPFKPTGDQPQAIKELSAGLEAGDDSQILLGVTGSGKTFMLVVRYLSLLFKGAESKKILTLTLINSFKASSGA